MTRSTVNVSFRISVRFKINVVILEIAVFRLKVMVKFMVRVRVTFRMMSMSCTRKCGYDVSNSRFKLVLGLWILLSLGIGLGIEPKS